MRLYAGMSAEFIEDAVQNRIASRLRDAFSAHYRFVPSPNEENAWRNSLRALSQVFQKGTLTDHGVILEYQLPLTSRRLDCLIAGQDADSHDEAVIIELKQWSECEETEEPTIVRTFLGGAKRDVLHPSAQVRQYRDYLADMHTAFYEGLDPVALSGCSYLHNYQAQRDDVLFSPRYEDALTDAPIFTADDVDPLVEYLRRRLEAGNGRQVLERVESSRYRPSKKLLEHVSEVIKNQPAFVLLDEQKVVFDRIFSSVLRANEHRKKQVFLINGGPGTGKSVIAIQLMAELSRKQRNAQYATGSQAFTKTLHKIVGPRAAAQFRYFNNYGAAAPSEIDVLICDEAHRLRPTSTNRFTPKSRQTDRTQIREIIDASKVAVFLIDDRQVVRPGEVGSPELIRNAAAASKCDLREYSLEAQFRCAGSDGFVNWVDNTLDVRKTANVLWNQSAESFEFRIFSTPEQLEEAIRMRASEGASARMTAGYCWPWSKTLKPDGTLFDDIAIGEYRRPWNARSGVTGLAPGIPREVHWAHDPRGIDQVGCVYTTQGFEFDYVGVLWGPDLVYEPGSGWRGERGRSEDWVVSRSGDRFTDLVKNTYRVLLSRGLKGCYVHFLDQNTEAFVRSRTEGLDASGHLTRPATQRPQRRRSQPDLPDHIRIVSNDYVQPYVNAVPLLDLQLAAGYFSNEQNTALEPTVWVSLPDSFRISRGLFVAQVTGESMNRRIPSGAWCLFKTDPVGSRENKIVVAEHRNVSDADTSTHVTVKRYRSVKVENEQGEWRHARIVLLPDSTEPRYKPIELSPKEAEDLKIVAEFVAVLG
jgi:uncharacterized protein